MKKKILITGGSGFLGKRLALALKADYQVVLAARNNKQNLLAQEFTGCQTIPMDVTRIESIRDVFSEAEPDIVIHAAATKYVDWSEKYPMECIDINVVGSQNVARVSLERKIETVIGVSTDKASPPIRNTYGLSKALMERMFCSLDGQSDSKFAVVRYGNVAWSTGSVLTIWKKMFDENGVIGTTGPEMRRFFFTIDEAVELVISALKNIDEVRGKVLSKKMKSVKMREILEIWIEENGGKYENISGRPGERNDEFLIGNLEQPFTKEIILNHNTHYLTSFNEKVDYPTQICLSSANAERLNRQEILAIINHPPVEEL